MPVIVEIGSARAVDANGQAMPIPLSRPRASESVAADETGNLQGRDGEFWTLTAVDEPMWAAFGVDEHSAAASPRRYLPENQPRDFFVTNEGEKVTAASAA